MNKRSTYIHLMSKKMRRTILRSPLQFLTMVLILALGSTLFSGLYSAHLVFQDQVNRIYQDSNIADITTTLLYDNNEVTQQEIKEDEATIKNAIGEAGKVESQYYSSGRIHGIDVNVIISDSYPTINKPTEIFGKYKDSQEEDNYFLFADSYLHNSINYGAKSTWIDDDGNYQPVEIQLNIASIKKLEHEAVVNKLKEYVKTNASNILDNDYLSLNVVPTGSMEHPENTSSSVSSPYSFITTRNFLIPYIYGKDGVINKNYDIAKLKQDIESHPEDELLKECLDVLDVEKKELTNQYWCNNRYLTRLNHRNEANKYRNKIDETFTEESKSDKILFNVKLTDSTLYQQLNTEALQSKQLCYVFPPLFFLVAVLIVLTTISQIILKERKEIGTLKAIGVSNRSILSYYMSLTGVISLIGVALGLVIGPLLLPKVLNLKFEMLYNLPNPRFIFPTLIAVIMTLVVLIITTLVAFLIARKEAKALPVTSMRPKPVNIKKKNISEAEEDNTHKLCFKMAVRNIFCSIPRSIMVIVGVLGCTALLCCGFGIDDSIQYGINNDTNMFFRTDSLIYFSNPTENTLNGLNHLVDNGVITACEPFGCLPSTASRSGVIEKTFSTNVYTINPYSENKFFNIGYKVKDSEVAVSNKVAKALNLHEGDDIVFNFLGNSYAGTIGKVIDVFYMHGIYIDGTFSNFPMVTQYPTSAYARFNKDLDKNEVMEQIRQVEGVSNVFDKKDLTGQITNISSSISYITLTIKIFAILLAVVALYNLALLNFKENIRNIATMKVLGFNRREVAESLFFEIITLSAVGALVGLTLGYPLTILTLSINQVPMCEFFYYISALSILISLLITLVVTSIINIFVGLRSKNVKMVESLKSVE